MISTPSLRISVALLVLAVMLGGASLGAWLYAHSSRNAAQAALEVAARKAGAQVRARQLALELAPRLARLEADGAFVQASRFDWATVLEMAGSAVPLPGLQWRMAARVPMKGLERLGFVTTISLDLALLHEGDLLRLQAWLLREAPGPWQFETCALAAAPVLVGAENPTATPQVTARCELSAYVFKGAST